jgi:hypothetical protein
MRRSEPLQREQAPRKRAGLLLGDPLMLSGEKLRVAATPHAGRAVSDGVQRTLGACSSALGG